MSLAPNPKVYRIIGRTYRDEGPAMGNALSALLERRAHIDAEIESSILPSWSVILTELGIPDDLQPIDIPTLAVLQSSFGITLPVRVRGRYGEKERLASHMFVVPVTTVSEDPDETRKAMRRHFPLHCTRCGLRHPAGTTRCMSGATCWGHLVWRSDAPRPKYYVDDAANHGYFDPGPRGLRYAIDLQREVILGAEVTLRDGTRWHCPIEAELRIIVRRISERIGADVRDAMLGDPTWGAESRCFSLELPGWATKYADSIPFKVRVARTRLLG